MSSSFSATSPTRSSPRTTDATTFPAAPTPAVANVQETQVTLSWGAVTGATSDVILEMPGPGTTGDGKDMTVPGTSLSGTVTGLSPGSSYHFAAAAANASVLSNGLSRGLCCSAKHLSRSEDRWLADPVAMDDV